MKKHVLAAAMLLVAGNALADDRPALRIGVAEVPPGLEPAQQLSNVGTRVTYSMFDTLIRRDFLSAPGGGGSKLVPHLATEWTRLSPTELRVKIRPGVKFHNGDELTSDDVVFTFAEGRLWGETRTIPEGPGYFGTLAKVEAEDRYTVKFTTRVPDVLLEQRLSSWCAWIVNKRAYEAAGIDGFAQAPVGTGPYKIKALKRDEAIELDAFDDYFMGKPTAKAVIFRQIPELASRTAGLASGEFDIITNVPPDQIATIRKYKDAELRSVVLANSHMLVFDQRGEAMGDKRIRKALSLAIDRKALVDALWHGLAEIPPGHNYAEYGDMFLADRKPPAFDPARAKQLLREAGYRGEKITYRTMPHYYTNALAAAQIMVEMWKAVGINAELKVVENFQQINAAGAQIGNWSNSTRFPDPLGAIWIAWGPKGPVQLRKAWTGVGAEAFSALGQKLEAATATPERRELFRQMLDVFEDEVPGTVLYQPIESYGVAKKVRWQPYTFYFMDLRPYNLSFSPAS